MNTIAYDDLKRFQESVANACSANCTLKSYKQGKGLEHAVVDYLYAGNFSENGLQQTQAKEVILTKF